MSKDWYETHDDKDVMPDKRDPETDHGHGPDLEEHPEYLADTQRKFRTALFWIAVVVVTASALTMLRVI